MPGDQPGSTLGIFILGVFSFSFSMGVLLGAELEELPPQPRARKRQPIAQSFRRADPVIAILVVIFVD